MPFNINTFKTSGLTYGGARPSLFRVVLSVPTALSISSLSVTKFSFMCRAASMPAFKQPPIEVPYFGRKIKVASGNTEFDDWPVTIMEDNDFSMRSMFELWMNAINSLEANIMESDLANEAYKADQEVDQFGRDGTLLRSYSMVGAFPTNIGEIELDWDKTGAIETFPLTFSYDYFLPLVESSSYQAGGVNSYAADTDVDGPLGS